MSNSVAYYLDPALLTPQALAGTAQVIPNPAAPFWASLFQACNMLLAREVIDTTATTLNLTVMRTSLKVSGTMTGTLPNGTFEGQRKIITCDSAASTPAYTLTITTADATAGHVTAGSVQFDTAGQEIEYVWTTPPGGTAAWRAVRVVRCGSITVTMGTTVLTTNVLSAVYNLTVSGTQSSTGTKGIPNGQVAGEQIHVLCSTASSIPNGNIAITGTTQATGVAASSLAGVNATTVQAQFQWDQTNNWQNLSLTTATYS
jgi:hypothetical protein